jgi:hypothetical protein
MKRKALPFSNVRAFLASHALPDPPRTAKLPEMNAQKPLLLAMALFTLAASPAQAQIPELDFSILGGANLNMVSRSDTSTLPDTSTGGMSWILGGTAGLGAIEVGLLVAQKTLNDAGDLTGSWSSVEIPVLYRFGFWPVTLGVGGFYSIPIGTDATDASWGLAFGPRVFLPGGLLLDTRFQWSLNEDRYAASSSSLQVMLGYSFF